MQVETLVPKRLANADIDITSRSVQMISLVITRCIKPQVRIETEAKRQAEIVTPYEVAYRIIEVDLSVGSIYLIPLLKQH